MSDLHLGERLTDLKTRIDIWFEEFLEHHGAVVAVDHGTSDNTKFGEPRWYVRMAGEQKDFITVWFTLGQRMLRYETYVMPAPDENQLSVAEFLLRRNDRLVGAQFSVGGEDAVFLRGATTNSAVTSDELDRILGTVWTTVEANFQTLLRLGFASRFDL